MDSVMMLPIMIDQSRHGATGSPIWVSIPFNLKPRSLPLKKTHASSPFSAITNYPTDKYTSLYSLVSSNRHLADIIVSKVSRKWKFNTYCREELLQNLLLRCQHSTFVYDRDSSESPAAILYTITNHLAIDMIRSRQRDHTIIFTSETGLTRVCDNLHIVTDNSLYIKELQHIFEIAIKELRANSKSQTPIDAFVMVVFDNLSESEVAKRLRIARSTVANGKKRCLERLRPIIKRLLGI